MRCQIAIRGLAAHFAWVSDELPAHLTSPGHPNSPKEDTMTKLSANMMTN